MIVIKKVENKFSKVEYPAIWKNPVIGLVDTIEYFEMNILPKPTEYDINKHDVAEKYVPTENFGEYLKVCNIDWVLTEKPKSVVLSNFNEAFGQFIDDAYPLWQRIKDLTQSTVEGDLRKAQEASLRDEREMNENNYINNNIFPNFNFTWL